MKQNALIIGVAILAIGAGYIVSDTFTDNDEGTPRTKSTLTADTERGIIVLDPPRGIRAPALLKDDGSVFSNDDIQDKWSLVFFGYTHCPDICPNTMGVVAAAKRRYESESGKDFPQVYFVSVDPKRDTIELLGEYVDYFDPDFTGITGEKKLIDALTIQSGVVYMTMQPQSEDEDSYLVDHSASLILISPEGALKAYLKAPHTVDSVINSIVELKS